MNIIKETTTWWKPTKQHPARANSQHTEEPAISIKRAQLPGLFYLEKSIKQWNNTDRTERSDTQPPADQAKHHATLDDKQRQSRGERKAADQHCVLRQATAADTALCRFAHQRAWHLPQTSAFSSGRSQNLPKLSCIVPVTAKGDIRQWHNADFFWQNCDPWDTIEKKAITHQEICSGLQHFHWNMQSQSLSYWLISTTASPSKDPRPEALSAQHIVRLLPSAWLTVPVETLLSPAGRS